MYEACHVMSHVSWRNAWKRDLRLLQLHVPENRNFWMHEILRQSCVMWRHWWPLVAVMQPFDKGQGKGHPRTGHECPDVEQMYSSNLPSTSTLDGVGWSTPRSGRFTPGKDPVPIVQEAGWAPGSVWTGAENLAFTEIRSPDRSARSEPLYRLSYRGPSPFDKHWHNLLWPWQSYSRYQ